MSVVTVIHEPGDPLAFFSVIATIVPVLFLAIVYQAQFHRTEVGFGPILRLFVGATAVAYGLTSEIISLHVLARGYPVAKDHLYTLAGLGFLALFVLVDPIVWLVRGSAEIRAGAEDDTVSRRWRAEWEAIRGHPGLGPALVFVIAIAASCMMVLWGT